jgi:hypothetical protein
MSPRDARALVSAAARALEARDTKQARVILNGLLKTWRPRVQETPRQKAKREAQGYELRQRARMVRKLYPVHSPLMRQLRNIPCD